MKQRTDEERIAMVSRIKASMKSGTGVVDACKQEGISDGCYYTWKNRLGKQMKKANKASPPVLVNIPMKSDDRVVLVYGNEKTVASVMDRLTLILRS